MNPVRLPSSPIRQANNNMLEKIPTLQTSYSMSIDLLYIKDLVNNFYKISKSLNTPTPPLLKHKILCFEDTQFILT